MKPTTNLGRKTSTAPFPPLVLRCTEADRMCELFGQCLPEPSSIQFRSDIVEQRVRENNAYAGYAEIRRQLLEAVRIGYEPSS
jgi:hypothetical protein